MTLIVEIITEIWNFLLIVAPWLILGLLIAGFIHSFIGENFVRKNLGGSKFGSIFKATLFGIPLPVCSCSVIPIAAGLRRDGASKASTMSFLVSTPTTGIDSIFVTYAFLGGIFAVARPVAALVAGLFIGILTLFSEREAASDIIKPHGNHASITFSERIRSALNYGFKVLPQDLSRTLLLGIVVGGLLAVLVPTDFASVYLSNPVIAYPLMIVISIPMYICAVGSVPIAAALLMKGLIPGAALAFLIAGPATNAITIGFVGRKLGKSTLFIYIASIIITAVVLGLLLDISIGGIEVGKSTVHGRHLPFNVQFVSALFLLVVLILNIRMKKEKVKDMDIELNVPGISCKHCKMTIEQELRKIEGVDEVNVSVDDKLVQVNGNINESVIIEGIEKAGYSVEI